MKLREFNLGDYEEVVNMYYEFTIEVFGDKRKISPKYFFYKSVIEWINSNKHIIVVCKDNEICGFSMSYIDECNGLTEPVYNCETCYIKQEFRNTRAAYLLYNNGYSVANDLRLNLLTNGRIRNGVSNMMKKHFDLEEQFINFERKI